jgi:hypothetical protein
MGRNRKSKRKKANGSGNNPGQAYNHFIKALYVLLGKYNAQKSYVYLSNEEKRYIYAFRWVVPVPVAAEGHDVSQAQLKRIGKYIQMYLRTDSHKFREVMLTAYELQVLYSFVLVINQFIRSDSRREFLCQKFPFVRTMGDLIDDVGILYLCNFLKVSTSLSCVNSRHYALNFRFGSLVKDNPVFEMIPQVSSYPAQSKVIPINGIERRVFRLGASYSRGEVRFYRLRAGVLGNHYKGRNESVEVYIQSHALNRLNERLDLLDEPGLNYSLWDNTENMKGFEFYRGYLLLPFRLYEIKIGYLAANVVKGVLVFRTFLFITHSSTPEGDRLKEITGLEKNDISYWRLDRLSTLLQADAEKYPGLMELFEQAGMGEILQLREKNLDLQSMQSANLERFMDYIQQGQNEAVVEEL